MEEKPIFDSIPTKKAFPTLGQSFAILGILVLFTIAAGVAIGALGLQPTNSLTFLLTYVLSFGVATFIAWQWGEKGKLELGGMNIKLLPWLCLATIALIFFKRAAHLFNSNVRNI